MGWDLVKPPRTVSVLSVKVFPCPVVCQHRRNNAITLKLWYLPLTQPISHNWIAPTTSLPRSYHLYLQPRFRRFNLVTRRSNIVSMVPYHRSEWCGWCHGCFAALPPTTRHNFPVHPLLLKVSVLFQNPPNHLQNYRLLRFVRIWRPGPSLIRRLMHGQLHDAHNE